MTITKPSLRVWYAHNFGVCERQKLAFFLALQHSKTGSELNKGFIRSYKEIAKSNLKVGAEEMGAHDDASRSINSQVIYGHLSSTCKSLDFVQSVRNQKVRIFGHMFIDNFYINMHKQLR